MTLLICEHCLFSPTHTCLCVCVFTVINKGKGEKEKGDVSLMRLSGIQM